ncbi:MAG TPA: 3-phosphoshikimate 1-carboxyvinyltransferase [Pyrinomonadaceae bacterium]|nr:3-phosphoshikimate 1-carboxyvinyltransferase [Pyrinomonadaceae bacterium]
MIIQPAKRIRGRLVMPGDKSISHRAAMIAALAEGTSRIKNLSTSADCAATLLGLQQLGVGIDHDGSDVLIHGVGANGLREPREPLDCGNSGTTMRLLAGILAGQNFESTLTGDESLCSRPMRRIVEPLEMMGAHVSSRDGRAPLMIEGRRPLHAISYELLVASAQVKSCILLAGLSAEGQTEVMEGEATRDHTERMLSWFGVSVETRVGEREGSRVAAIEGPARFNARDISIPGDLSSAAYFVAAAALLPGSKLAIENVGLNATRDQFLSTLQSLGANISRGDPREDCNEPSGTIEVRSETMSLELTELTRRIRGSVISQLIDELPLLAVVGSQVEGGIEIRDAAELRVKESDRIAKTAQNLRAMGAAVEEFDDGLRVSGPTQLHGAAIDPRGDHRIAMAFSVAGLIADGETEIQDAGCVAVSFPEFFNLLDAVVER